MHNAVVLPSARSSVVAFSRPIGTFHQPAVLIPATDPVVSSLPDAEARRAPHAGQGGHSQPPTPIPPRPLPAVVYPHHLTGQAPTPRPRHRSPAHLRDRIPAHIRSALLTTSAAALLTASATAGPARFRDCSPDHLRAARPPSARVPSGLTLAAVNRPPPPRSPSLPAAPPHPQLPAPSGLQPPQPQALSRKFAAAGPPPARRRASPPPPQRSPWWPSGLTPTDQRARAYHVRTPGPAARVAAGRVPCRCEARRLRLS